MVPEFVVTDTSTEDSTMSRHDTHPDPGHDTNCEAFVHADGWYEIRERDGVDGWLRTDTPVPVRR
jgi:hypothetical protein